MDLSLPFSLTLSSLSLIYELSIAFNTNLNYFKRRIFKNKDINNFNCFNYTTSTLHMKWFVTL